MKDTPILARRIARVARVVGPYYRLQKKLLRPQPLHAIDSVLCTLESEAGKGHPIVSTTTSQVVNFCSN